MPAVDIKSNSSASFQTHQNGKSKILERVEIYESLSGPHLIPIRLKERNALLRTLRDLGGKSPPQNGKIKRTRLPDDKAVDYDVSKLSAERQRKKSEFRTYEQWMEAGLEMDWMPGDNFQCEDDDNDAPLLGDTNGDVDVRQLLTEVRRTPSNYIELKEVETLLLTLRDDLIKRHEIDKADYPILNLRMSVDGLDRFEGISRLKNLSVCSLCVLEKMLKQMELERTSFMNDWEDFVVTSTNEERVQFRLWTVVKWFMLWFFTTGVIFYLLDDEQASQSTNSWIETQPGNGIPGDFFYVPPAPEGGTQRPEDCSAKVAEADKCLADAKAAAKPKPEVVPPAALAEISQRFSMSELENACFTAGFVKENRAAALGHHNALSVDHSRTDQTTNPLRNFIEWIHSAVTKGKPEQLELPEQSPVKKKLLRRHDVQTDQSVEIGSDGRPSSFIQVKNRGSDDDDDRNSHHQYQYKEEDGNPTNNDDGKLAHPDPSTDQIPRAPGTDWKHWLRVVIRMLYFHAETISTTGWGDVVPVSQSARLFSICYIFIVAVVFIQLSDTLVRAFVEKNNDARTDLKMDDDKFDAVLREKTTAMKGDFIGHDWITDSVILSRFNLSNTEQIEEANTEAAGTAANRRKEMEEDQPDGDGGGNDDLVMDGKHNAADLSGSGGLDRSGLHYNSDSLCRLSASNEKGLPSVKEDKAMADVKEEAVFSTQFERWLQLGYDSNSEAKGWAFTGWFSNRGRRTAYRILAEGVRMRQRPRYRRTADLSKEGSESSAEGVDTVGSSILHQEGSHQKMRNHVHGRASRS